MTKLLIAAGTVAGGYLADRLVSNQDMMVRLIVGGIGSMVGVYAGWKLARKVDEWTES